MVWLCRAEFGAIALGFFALIVRLIVRGGGALLREALGEDWLLLVGSLATAGRVAMLPWLGDVGAAWIWVFAATCATHLAVKGFRQLELRT